jgi:hypothetical protein
VLFVVDSVLKNHSIRNDLLSWLQTGEYLLRVVRELGAGGNFRPAELSLRRDENPVAIV